MKRNRWLAAVCISVLGCSYAGLAKAGANDPLPLASVISQVKYELAAAQKVAAAGNNLRLEKVDIILSVSRSVDANGKATIGVPAISVEAGGSGSRKAEELSTLQVELAAPAGSITLSGNEIDGLGLAQMIIDTRRQLRAGLDQAPKLDPQKLVMSVKFGVARTGGGSANVKLVVLSIGGGATITSSDSHTVVLTFAKQKAPES
jgi:hypothetical protein